MKSTVLIATNVPTPYRMPLFDALGRKLDELNLRLHVVFGTANESRRKWQVDLNRQHFTSEFLEGWSIPLGADSPTYLHGGFLPALRRVRPCLVVVSGFAPVAVQCLLARACGGPPYVIWSGARHHHGRWRGLQRKLLLACSAGSIVYGTEAYNYLLRLNESPERVRISINTVDTSFFAVDEGTIGPAEFSQPARFLCVGYLYPQKRVDLVLDAAAELAKRRRDFKVVVVGEGDQRQILETRVRALALEDVVEFRGDLPAEGVKSELRKARALLFPSDYDIWGLVVVEAMAMGIPCLASVRSGVTEDLVIDGHNGFRVDFHEPKLTAELMERLLDDPMLSRLMGGRARSHVAANASMDIAAGQFAEAIRVYLERSASRKPNSTPLVQSGSRATRDGRRR